MSASTARVGAVIRKELAEFRRNRLIVTTAAALPVLFLIGPTASILTIKASALSTALDRRVDDALFLPLLIPVLVPAIMSAYSVVGEREQGTLEPVLTTPVSGAELLIGKAAAIFMPAVALGYLIFGVFVAITQLAASSAVAAAVRHAPQLPAALVFIPLLAAWAIWVGLAISTRVTDTRVAQQLSVLGSLPPARAGRADVVPGDKPDVRAGRRPGRRPAGGRLRRLPGGGPAVRPGAPHHRGQAQPRHHRTGHGAGDPVPKRSELSSVTRYLAREEAPWPSDTRTT